MSAQDLAYAKFVSLIVESGLWANMSPAARTLYPVLLRFTDGQFKPVYPGGNRLLELTGFKQKSTLRKARNELVMLGLISISRGSGRQNTFYHFRFDTLRGAAVPPWEMAKQHPAGQTAPPQESADATAGGLPGHSPYNKIHISINNNVHKEAEKETIHEQHAALRKLFGDSEVDLAVSECRLAGISESHENLEKILYRSHAVGGTSWSRIEKNLTNKISGGSLQMIENAHIGEKNGAVFFSDSLPEYLKELLRRECPGVFFEPSGEMSERRQFWQRAGTIS